MAQVSLKNAVMRIKDGGTNSITVAIGDGNLTFSQKRAVEYNLNRGLLDENAEVREGDDAPMDVSFQFIWKYITGANNTAGTGVSVSDAITKTGGAAAWVTADDDPCRPYSVDLEIEYAPPCATGNSAETITLPNFRWEELQYDMKAGTVSCSGKCSVLAPTSVRHPSSTNSDQ